MPVRGPGPYQLRKLSRELRLAGNEGKGLRRELFRAITVASRPLAKEIKDPAHLRSYMPNRYADVLAADLSVTTSKSTGRNPGVAIKAKGRKRKRKVQLLDSGLINHPVYARGDRATWNWENGQAGGMRAGFFDDPATRAAPEIRRQVLDAMHAVGKKITS